MTARQLVLLQEMLHATWFSGEWCQQSLMELMDIAFFLDNLFSVELIAVILVQRGQTSLNNFRVSCLQTKWVIWIVHVLRTAIVNKPTLAWMCLVNINRWQRCTVLKYVCNYKMRIYVFEILVNATCLYPGLHCKTMLNPKFYSLAMPSYFHSVIYSQLC